MQLDHELGKTRAQKVLRVACKVSRSFTKQELGARAGDVKVESPST